MATCKPAFVKLKYRILSSDSDTWVNCKTYPTSALSKWAWRCVAHVEHLANDYPQVINCIAVGKDYRDGAVDGRELRIAYEDSTIIIDNYREASAAAAAEEVAAAAMYAAECTTDPILAARALNSVALALYESTDDEEKASAVYMMWKNGAKWLIEELCKWEDDNN